MIFKKNHSTHVYFVSEVAKLFRVPFTMFLWGVGKVGDAALVNFLSMFLLYYYNQVLGLSAVLAGVALFISTLIDAVSDPLVGYYSDVQQALGNSRLRLMDMVILPIAFLIVVIFSIPQGMSDTFLFFMLTVAVSFLRLGQTLFNIPREAVGVELYRGYEDRNSLWGVNAIFGVVGSGIALGPILLFLITDWRDEKGYFFASLWVACVYIVSCKYSVKNLSRKYTAVSEEMDSFRSSRGLTRNPKYSLGVVFSQTKVLFSNESWKIMFIVGLLFSVQLGLTSGTAIYVNTLFWGLSSSELFWGGVISVPGTLLGACIITLSNKENIDKKRMILIAGCFAVALGHLLIAAKYLEWLLDLEFLTFESQRQFGSLWFFWAVQQLVQNTIWVVFWVLFSSMFSDVIEDVKIDGSEKVEGFVLSANNFFNKIVLSSGAIIGGALLTFLGFDVDLTQVEEYDSGFVLACIVALTSVITTMVSIFLLKKYKIDRRSHNQNIQGTR